MLIITCTRRSSGGFIFGHEFDSRHLHHPTTLFGRGFYIAVKFLFCIVFDNDMLYNINIKGVDTILIIKQIITAAETVAKEFPIIGISLFGSYAESRNTEDSDVDILVEFSPQIKGTLLTVCSV